MATQVEENASSTTVEILSQSMEELAKTLKAKLDLWGVPYSKALEVFDFLPQQPTTQAPLPAQGRNKKQFKRHLLPILTEAWESLRGAKLVTEVKFHIGTYGHRKFNDVDLQIHVWTNTAIPEQRTHLNPSYRSEQYEDEKLITYNVAVIDADTTLSQNLGVGEVLRLELKCAWADFPDRLADKLADRVVKLRDFAKHIVGYKDEADMMEVEST